MAPDLRPYRAQDRAGVQAIFYRAVHEGAAAHYSIAERTAWAPLPATPWDGPDPLLGQDCLVAEEDGRMTGFFSMDHAGYLDMAFVLPDVMGNGTAAALYDAVMARARARGVTRFTVRAAEQSRRFLGRRSWVVQARERVTKGDEVFHTFLMALDNSAPARSDTPSRLIRPYTAADRAALAQIRFRAIREGSAAQYSLAEREAWAPSPDPDFSAPDKFQDHFCYLVEAGGRPTGFMSMDKTGFLDSAYVLPEVMGDGTAAVLYDRMMIAARASGLRHFSVHAVNASRRFLARRGWQFDGIGHFEEDGHAYEVNLMSLDDSAAQAALASQPLP